MCSIYHDTVSVSKESKETFKWIENYFMVFVLSFVKTNKNQLNSGSFCFYSG